MPEPIRRFFSPDAGVGRPIISSLLLILLHFGTFSPAVAAESGWGAPLPVPIRQPIVRIGINIEGEAARLESAGGMRIQNAVGGKRIWKEVHQGRGMKDARYQVGPTLIEITEPLNPGPGSAETSPGSKPGCSLLHFRFYAGKCMVG